MIKIYIDGEQLDMPANLSLTYKKDSVLYENELIRGEYSYPFSFPLTERNRRLLGYINELHREDAEYKKEVLWELLGNLRPAMLYIDKITYNHNSKYGVCEGNIVGVEGLFYSLIAGKMIKEMDLGSNFTIPSYTVNTYPGTASLPSVTRYAKDILTGVITGTPFVFPMLGTTAEPEPWTYGDVTAGINFNHLQRIHGCVNYYDIVDDKYPDLHQGFNVFLRPYEGDSSGIVANQMVPMFYNYWILEKIFTTVGFTISGDIYEDTDFRKTILTNNYCINRWEHRTQLSQVVELATEINPHDHVGELLVEDYLNSLCKIYCASFEFDLVEKTVRFNSKRTYLESNDNIIISNAEVSSTVVQEAKNGNGLSLNYTFNNDSFVSDFINSEVQPEDIAGEVDTFADLAALSVPLGSIYYVRATHSFFIQNKLNDWQGTGYNISDYKPENADNVEVDLSTAVNYDFQPAELDGTDTVISIPIYSDSISLRGQRFIAGTLGSDSISFTRFTDERYYIPTPKILYYHGYQKSNDGTVSYPYASASNYSRDETTPLKLANHSLGWLGSEGLVAYRYAEWIAFYKRKVKHTFTLYLDMLKINSLTIYRKIQMLGQVYILRSTKIKVPYNGIVETEAYKI